MRREIGRIKKGIKDEEGMGRGGEAFGTMRSEG